MIIQEFPCYHDLSPHLRPNSRPTQPSAPIWPDSSTGGALHRNRRDRGSNPRSGACFSKVPKLFGRISGDIILFVSSKRRRLEARNFAVIFIFIPFTTY